MNSQQQSIGAAHPDAVIPSEETAFESLADRIECGATGNLAQRLALGLRIGQILRRRHARQDFHGAFSARCILLDHRNRILVEESATGGRERSRQGDVRAFGELLFELVSGESRSCGGAQPQPAGVTEADLYTLLNTGYAEPLVAIIRQCAQCEEPAGKLAEAVAQLEKVLREMRKQPSRTDERTIFGWMGAIALIAAAILAIVLRYTQIRL